MSFPREAKSNRSPAMAGRRGIKTYMKAKTVKVKEPEKEIPVAPPPVFTKVPSTLDFKNPGKFKKQGFQTPPRFTNVRSFGGHR